MSSNRLHVTWVSEAYAVSVRQNDEGTYERLRAAQEEERRRQETARAADEAAKAQVGIRSFFSVKCGSGSYNASGSGNGGT